MGKTKGKRKIVKIIVLSVLGMLSAFVLAVLIIGGREGHSGPFKGLAEAKIISAYKKRPKGEIVFYGASNFTLWKDMEKDLAPYAVQNHGFGGSRDVDLVACADKLLYQFEPSIVVIQTGSNDLNMGTTVEDVIAGKDAMYKEFAEHLPNTRFIVMSGLPCPGRPTLWADTERINDYLRRYCAVRDNMVFADATALMTTESGGFRPDYFNSDGIHLNTEGRAVWRDFILERLAEAGGLKK
jgi:lysophospholipase L1-like esterase